MITPQSHPLLFVRAARGLPFKSGEAFSVSPAKKPSFLGSLLGLALFLICVVEAGVLFK